MKRKHRLPLLSILLTIPLLLLLVFPMSVLADDPTPAAPDSQVTSEPVQAPTPEETEPPQVEPTPQEPEPVEVDRTRSHESRKSRQRK